MADCSGGIFCGYLSAARCWELVEWRLASCLRLSWVSGCQPHRAGADMHDIRLAAVAGSSGDIDLDVDIDMRPGAGNSSSGAVSRASELAGPQSRPPGAT